MAIHVVPAEDAIEHTASDDCACGVTLEPVERDDGTTGKIHVHHALDGRVEQDALNG